MEGELLRKVQLTQLEILKEFKRICTLLNLPYILASGTLLGAIRHNGFIPWDDDIDVEMDRTAYNVFLVEAPKYLSDRFFLQTWYSDEKYGLPFAKIRMNGTIYIENAAQNAEANCGIYIDLFPYDVYPGEPEKRKIQGRRIQFYKRLMLMKYNYSPWLADAKGIKKGIKYIYYLPYKLIAAVSGREQIIRKYEDAAIMYDNEPSGFLFPCGSYNYGKWVVPEDCFKEHSTHIFEDEEFMIPKDYDAYLSSVYGDYMKLPPKEQQVNRHNIIKVKFYGEE